MALAKYLKGVQLLIQVGDGADPEVFAHPCLINASRGINITAETNDIKVPDCSDPDLMAWLVREKTAVSATIDGAGVLNTPDTEIYFNWVKSSAAKNIRINLNGVSGANGGGRINGVFHLTQFQLQGDRGDLVQCTIKMDSTGELTWTDAS